MRKRLLFASLAASLISAIAVPLVAHATPLSVCSFTQVGSAWSLDASCTSTHQIDIPTGVTLNGHGHTISPNFTITDTSNNSVLGILSNNVTVKNLMIDGVGGTNLHGINIFVATGVVIKNVTIKNNDHFGIVVNGSTVSVSHVTTSGNGWGGIDVDMPSDVTTPAVLNIVGKMWQTDTVFGFPVHIYVDDTTKKVTVFDKLHQYSSISPTGNLKNPHDRVYFLKPVTCKGDDCKKDHDSDSEDRDNGDRQEDHVVFANRPEF